MNTAIASKLVGLSIFAFYPVLTYAEYSSDSFVGTYEVQENGTRRDFIKITKNNGLYYMSEKSKNNWGLDSEVKPVSSQDLSKLYGQSGKNSISALANSHGVAIVQVPKGWKAGELSSKTGFFLQALFIPIELYKR